MLTSTRALLTCPRLSFPSRTGPRRCLGAAARPLPVSPTFLPRRPRGKGAEPLIPRTPYPSAFGARPSEEGRSPDTTSDLASFAGPPDQTVRGQPQTTSPRALDRQPSSTPPPAADAILKERRQNHQSQPHQDMPLTPAQLWSRSSVGSRASGREPEGRAFESRRDH